MCLFVHTVPGIIINSQRAQLFMEYCKCIAIYSYKYRERHTHVRYLYIIWMNNQMPVTEAKINSKVTFPQMIKFKWNHLYPAATQYHYLFGYLDWNDRVFFSILAIIRRIAVAAITLCHMLHRKIAAIQWFIAFMDIWSFWK